MANKRMFTMHICDSDAFLDMPLSSQCLYFHLNMRADDDGFIDNPKRIMKIVGASEDDLKMLILKSFVLTFDSGVIVIKHWRMHNTISKSRYHETQYLDEKSMLFLKENGSYSFSDGKTLDDTKVKALFEWRTSGEQVENAGLGLDIDLDLDIGTDNIINNNIYVETEKDNVCSFVLKNGNRCSRKSELEINGKCYCGQHSRMVLQSKTKNNFVPPTVEEVKQYCHERQNQIDAESFVDFYESKGWMIGKSKMKDWKAAVRTWEKNNKNKVSEKTGADTKQITLTTIQKELANLIVKTYQNDRQDVNTKAAALVEWLRQYPEDAWGDKLATLSFGVDAFMDKQTSITYVVNFEKFLASSELAEYISKNADKDLKYYLNRKKEMQKMTEMMKNQLFD